MKWAALLIVLSLCFAGESSASSESWTVLSKTKTRSAYHLTARSIALADDPDDRSDTGSAFLLVECSAKHVRYGELTVDRGHFFPLTSPHVWFSLDGGTLYKNSGKVVADNTVAIDRAILTNVLIGGDLKVQVLANDGAQVEVHFGVNADGYRELRSDCGL